MSTPESPVAAARVVFWLEARRAMILLSTVLRVNKWMVTAVNGFDVPGWLEAASAVEGDLAQLTAALTEAQFHAPPRDGGWSVGYCIEHLVLTGQAFLQKWDPALKEAGKEGFQGEQRFRYEWWQRLLLRYTENPSRLKYKAPPPLVPSSRHSMEKTVARFQGMHRELANRVAVSRGLDVRRTKVQSPFVSWIWYGLGFSFDLALAHERRHLDQAWRVRRQLTDGR